MSRETEILVSALKQIALRGGNLPDDRLTSKTGPNDAVIRGLMYVDSRDIARAAIAEHAKREAAPELAKLAEWIEAHADDQDWNHVDFRIRAHKLAEAALAKALPPQEVGE